MYTFGLTKQNNMKKATITLTIQFDVNTGSLLDIENILDIVNQSLVKDGDAVHNAQLFNPDFTTVKIENI